MGSVEQGELNVEKVVVGKFYFAQSKNNINILLFPLCDIRHMTF